MHVSTCFLFIQHLTDTSCLSLLLDDDKKVSAALALRTFADIQLLQQAAKTIIVLPCERCSIHHIPLPWISEQKARLALLYALEEQLAQPVASVHIAFDKKHYQNKHYLAVAIDRVYLQQVIDRLNVSIRPFDKVTLDWFALGRLDACISETSVLAYDDIFQGALSTELAAMYFSKRQSQTPIWMFHDSAPAMKSTTFELMDGSFYEWVAKRLLETQPMNVCQGDLQLSTVEKTYVRWYQLCLGLACVSLSIFLITYGLASYQLSHQMNTIDKEIATQYHEFFPNASTVISPRFRVEQLLKSQTSNADEVLWTLLDKLAFAIGQVPVSIEQFNYDQSMVSLTLTASDFSALEALQLRLQKAQVHVTQVQASLHEKHAQATLELRL